MYHKVFYQAIDDNLRIVYSIIMKNIKFLMMRDKDGMYLLNQRDYELIKLSFKIQTTKLKHEVLNTKKLSFRCKSYRKYNEAYYEEIIINNINSIEERVIQNYRERFLIEHE